jgi:methylmalonyl-CoA mutase
MPESTIHNILSKSFPKTGIEDWLRVASQELGEKNQIEKLIWESDGLSFSPYYEKKNLKNLNYLKSYQSRPSQSWENVPKIIVSDEKEANERTLQQLTSGADGVLFDLSERIDFNINPLLQGVDWSACSLYFIMGPDTKIATKILAYADHKGYDPATLTGTIFWTTPPQAREAKDLIKPLLKRYHTLGLTIAQNSAVEEISKSLQQATHIVDVLTDMGMEAADVFKAISLSFSCDTNFLITIAKLKAIRVLWYQLSQAFGIKNYVPEALHIHLRSEHGSTTRFDPHGRMIKNTTDGLCAVLGGCNALTLSGGEKENEMEARIALNVSNILKEESLIDKVSDPLGGAYAIENMVNEISQSAWKMFQNNMRS